MSHMIFTPEERALLEKIGTAVTIQQRSILFYQGDAADMLYYIQRGRVRVFQITPSGREVNLDVVEAGHIIGESAFGEQKRRPACVQAVNTVSLLAFSLEDLLPLFQTKPTLALHFLQQCSDTMDRLASRLHEQCLLDRYGKVASFILDLTATESTAKGTKDGILPYTHENIALSLGLSRTTVTSVLGYFEQQGWLKSGYGQIRILDRQALLEYVHQKSNQ